MAAIKLVNFIALLTLAVLAISFNVTPVNAVGAHEAAHHGRSLANHNALAKKRRQNTNTGRRCRQRTSSLLSSATAAPVSSSLAPVPTSAASSQAEANTQAPPASTQPAPVNTQKNETPATSSQAAPPASTPAPPANNGGGRSNKASIAWHNQDTQSLRNWSKASAIYNWSPWVDPLYKELGFTTMAMCWCWKQVEQFAQLTAQDGYADWAMGPNEPNESSQSNMSPADAAKLWRQYINPLQYKGYKLVGPACTSAPNAIDWYKQYLAACSDCKHDALALHYYGTDPDAMIGYMQAFHEAFPQYQIMVTEFACQNFGGPGGQCDEGQVYNFMKKVTAWMDGQWFIKYYFAFGVLHDMYNVNPLNQLLGGDGKPNSLGWTYLSS